MPNLPTSNNNPGDLKSPATGQFEQFQDPNKGFEALKADLKGKMTGNTRTGLGPQSTLKDLAYVWAPPSDNNDSEKYANNLSKKLKVAPTAPLASLNVDDLAGAIASNEGYQGSVPSSTRLSSKDFAAKIKAKYPQYQNIDDDTLTQKIIAKYPQYKDSVGDNSTSDSSGFPTTKLEVPQDTEPPVGEENQGQGFLKGLSEDLSGTNPESIGTQMANTVKGVGNFLFPIIGDVGNDLTGKNNKTALQQAGDLGMSVLPFIPGLGELGEGARATKLAGTAAKSTGLLGKLAGSTVAKGVGSGYGAGTLANLSQGQGLVQSLTPNATNVESALTGGVASKVIPGLAGKLGAGAPDVERAIQDAMPLENKATRIDALRSSMPDSQGGVVRKGVLGKSTIVPDQEDIERGTAAAPYIGTTKDPVEQIKNLNKGIQDESSRTDSFLNDNAAPSNFSDMRDYMETNTPNKNLQKDPAAFESYQRATQDALDTLYATMKKSANETGDFGAKTSGANIRKARIEIDQQISKELGENVWGTPQYKGIKAAEMDTRNLLNRMSEDMLRYPGQLPRLNKLNQFISSAKQRGIEVDMNNPQVRSQLETQFGLIASPENEAKAQALSEAHKKMSRLYDARDNVIDKYQRKIGKNKVQEAADNNPIIKAGVDIGKKAIPFGIGSHL